MNSAEACPLSGILSAYLTENDEKAGVFNDGKRKGSGRIFVLGELVMSFIYNVLKPILRKATAKKSSMTRADFIRQAEKVQK